MLHEVIVQVRKEVANELRQQQAQSDAAKELQSVSDQFDIELVPQHVGAIDEELASYFSIMTSDANTAQQIAQRYAECQGVTAAYSKSQGGPP